ncbi:MerR family transcriptional regulator [Agrobacterium sp. FDAARGOS_525]|uniref:chaperone modulator CbpM n=1 Tax=Agrobacterium sp. FDAARGOS_525 TaxID=2420311 RepID=UPI000F686441|nr:chaperone modulator CbpM [Agrobacterium sp. FDAARGOS_525]RSC30040.1 MerR family transcriptional regulator [Agrobacterium sp. FDAARGOS_525]
MDDHEFRYRLKIEVSELELWLREGWIAPRIDGDQRRFQDADVARARLILDLTRDMGVNRAGIDIVMDLVDQLHSLRRVTRDILQAIGKEDRAVQRRLLTALDELPKSRL